jgi:hypothetical protein
LVSPEYVATIESVPAVDNVVVQAAVRDALSVTAEQPPIAVPLEVKATVPVGLGLPEGLTVAVNVTDWHVVDGFTLETSAVVVAVPLPRLTTWLTAGEVLPVIQGEPLYLAVRLYVPVVVKVWISVAPS